MEICFPKEQDDITYTVFTQSEPTLLYRLPDFLAGSFTCRDDRHCIVSDLCLGFQTILELALLHGC